MDYRGRTEDVKNEVESDSADASAEYDESAAQAQMLDGNVDNLYTALCIYLGLPPQRDPETVISTALAALEYAATVAKMSEIPKASFDQAVDAAWSSVQGNLIKVVKKI